MACCSSGRPGVAPNRCPAPCSANINPPSRTWAVASPSARPQALRTRPQPAAAAPAAPLLVAAAGADRRLIASGRVRASRYVAVAGGEGGAVGNGEQYFDGAEAVRASAGLMRRIRGCTTVSKLSKAVIWGSRSGVLDGISASFALSRLAKIANARVVSSGAGGDALWALEEHLMENVGAYSARSLATAIHSLGKLGVRDDTLFAVAAGQVLRHTAEYKPQEVSMTLWGFAKAGQIMPEIFHALGRQVVNKALFFKPQELSMAVWAYATVGIPSPTLFMTVEQEVVDKLSYFKPQEVANVLWAFAISGQKAPELFAAAEPWTLGNINRLNPADLSMVLWAFAKAGHGSPSFFKEMSAVVAKCTGGFSPSGAAGVLWGLASAGYASPELLESFAEVLQGQGLVHKLKPRDLCTIVWAYASGGYHCQLVDDLLQMAQQMVELFQPRDISMLLTGCVQLGLTQPGGSSRGKSEPLLDRLAERATDLLTSFKPVDLALTLWSFATLGPRPAALPFFKQAVPVVVQAAPWMQLPNLTRVVWAYGLCHSRICKVPPAGGTDSGRPFAEVFDAIAPLVVDGAANMTAQGLVLTVQGYSRAQHYSVEVFAAVELQVLGRRADALTPQGLAQLLLAYAAVKDPGVRLFDDMEERVLQQIKDFTPQGLANILHAYTRMNIYSPKLFSAVEAQALHLASSFVPMDVSSLLWAFAKQSHSAEQLFRVLEPRTRELLPSLSGRDISSILWAHASAGMEAPELCQELVEAASALSTPLYPRDLLNAVWACSHLGVWTEVEQQETVEHATADGDTSARTVIGSNGSGSDHRPVSARADAAAAPLRERLLTALAPAVQRTGAAAELRGRLASRDLCEVVATYSRHVSDPEVVAKVLVALKPAVVLSLSRSRVPPEDAEVAHEVYRQYASQAGDLSQDLVESQS